MSQPSGLYRGHNFVGDVKGILNVSGVTNKAVGETSSATSATVSLWGSFGISAAGSSTSSMPVGQLALGFYCFGLESHSLGFWVPGLYDLGSNLLYTGFGHSVFKLYKPKA